MRIPVSCGSRANTLREHHHRFRQANRRGNKGGRAHPGVGQRSSKGHATSPSALSKTDPLVLSKSAPGAVNDDIPVPLVRVPGGNVWSTIGALFPIKLCLM
jgi:hypothetical protein